MLFSDYFNYNCFSNLTLRAADFPLLMHMDDILAGRRAVDIPQEMFMFEA